MLSYDPSMNSQPPSTAGMAHNVKPVSASSAMDSTSATMNGSVNGQQHKYHHIWLVTGPAGCGKSTVAEFLANQLNMPYIEGDAFHTTNNVEKMRNGIPLTDADRWDWLTALRDESVRQINGGSDGVVLTCSALKRKYRDVIRVAAYYDHHVLVRFIFLDAPEEVLLQRVSKRENHYMGANMVHSQFDILERPSADEKDVSTIDVSRPLEEVKKNVLETAAHVMAEKPADD